MKKDKFLKWIDAATKGLDNPEISFQLVGSEGKLEFIGGETETDFLSDDEDRMNILLKIKGE